MYYIVQRDYDNKFMIYWHRDNHWWGAFNDMTNKPFKTKIGAYLFLMRMKRIYVMPRAYIKHMVVVHNERGQYNGTV